MASSEWRVANGGGSPSLSSIVIRYSLFAIRYSPAICHSPFPIRRYKREAERRQTHCLMSARKQRAGRATRTNVPPARASGALACRRSTPALTVGPFGPRAQGTHVKHLVAISETCLSEFQIPQRRAKRNQRVGWAERRETHQFGAARRWVSQGLNPPAGWSAARCRAAW